MKRRLLDCWLDSEVCELRILLRRRIIFSQFSSFLLDLVSIPDKTTQTQTLVWYPKVLPSRSEWPGMNEENIAKKAEVAIIYNKIALGSAQ